MGGRSFEEVHGLPGLFQLPIVRYEGGVSDPAWSVVCKIAPALGKSPNDFHISPPNDRG